MLRRAALYGIPNYGAEWEKSHSALFSCLETRFGRGRVWRRSNKDFDPSDVASEVAVAVIQGLRGGGKQFLEACLAKGIPTIVVDLAWLRRERGYWQASINGLNRPPERAPSYDRFEELDLKVFPLWKKNYNTVIAGQLPGDAQHDLETDRDVVEWAKSQALIMKKMFPKRRVYWRPHPSFRPTLHEAAVLTSPDRPIKDLIRDENVGSALVYNSTLGIELLRQGVHVVAQGPRTVYTDLVSSDISDLENSHPGPDAVRDLLARLAYGQYKDEELSDWKTFEKLFELHGITGDW